MAHGGEESAIELWNSKVPMATISKHLKISKRTLSMILAREEKKSQGPFSDGKKSDSYPLAEEAGRECA